MEVNFLDLLKEEPATNQVRTSLTIVPFYEFLKQKLAEDNGRRKPFFQHALDTIVQTPGWDQPITEGNIDQFKNIFELIYFTFSSPVADEGENAWALAKPFTEELFYETDAFYKLLTSHDGKLKKNLLSDEDVSRILFKKTKIIYSMILKRFYNVSTSWKPETIHSYKDEVTNLNRYYRLNFDNQFIHIGYDGKLPEIDLASIEMNQENEEEKIAGLQKILPFDNFYFEGFSIVKLTNITAEYAFNHIKDIIVSRKPGSAVYKEVARSLKNLLGNKNIDINLLPMLLVNNKLAIDGYEDVGLNLNNYCSKHKFDKTEYIDALGDYIKDPRLVFYPDIQVTQPAESEVVRFFRNKGVASLGLIPVAGDKDLVGIIEILSKEKNQFSAQCLSVLTPVLPLLRQLLENTIDEFQAAIDTIIKKNFTPLQSAVQWRFNEAAWHYLRQDGAAEKNEIEQVFFPQVYPIYGAIDIRNSSQMRNQALQTDMYFRLNLLTDLLNKLLATTRMELIDELISKAYGWGNQLLETISPEIELGLLLFLKNEAEPVIEHFRKYTNDFSSDIDNYFAMVAPEGKAYESRRALEKSLQMVNTTISRSLEELNERIQKIYPCYFEKLRTDGIEYDIYMGQSVAPDKKFDPLFLHDLRLEQLSSMVTITRRTQALLPSLPKKMETTQLIFIHSNPIDISFRIDERRFDVEGTYNIRYEMAKKRIDKVHIKDSKERLTQPGKIAMVYFQQRDTEEYLSYIQYLQGKGYLEKDIEFLDLEYLQGINGLKALRVTVKT